MTGSLVTHRTYVGYSGLLLLVMFTWGASAVSAPYLHIYSR